ncbi:hypothetical protein [Pedobacter sp. SYP-B3415]|uniref:hypothetical protein n=1 Tax=Pedobacter sp. SYP-B3415 TaxID=2496641 RepID=UPI00101CC17D|nr:hypothetical protein [Pedobacter sp. SYP-B3415]
MLQRLCNKHAKPEKSVCILHLVVLRKIQMPKSGQIEVFSLCLCIKFNTKSKASLDIKALDYLRVSDFSTVPFTVSDRCGVMYNNGIPVVTKTRTVPPYVLAIGHFVGAGSGVYPVCGVLPHFQQTVFRAI